MPMKGGRLTPQEARFAEQFVATGDRRYAATQAGYKQPQQRAADALARPAVQAEIVRRQVERLVSDALPIAVNTLILILQDAKAPAGARVQAAKVVFDRTLGTDDAGRRKDPADMTPAELAEAIDQLKRVAADRSKLVIEHDQPPASVFD